VVSVTWRDIGGPEHVAAAAGNSWGRIVAANTRGKADVVRVLVRIVVAVEGNFEHQTSSAPEHLLPEE
jgi:hypothetical protein